MSNYETEKTCEQRATAAASEGLAHEAMAADCRTRAAASAFGRMQQLMLAEEHERIAEQKRQEADRWRAMALEKTRERLTERAAP